MGLVCDLLPRQAFQIPFVQDDVIQIVGKAVQGIQDLAVGLDRKIVLCSDAALQLFFAFHSPGKGLPVAGTAGNGAESLRGMLCRFAGFGVLRGKLLLFLPRLPVPPQPRFLFVVGQCSSSTRMNTPQGDAQNFSMISLHTCASSAQKCRRVISSLRAFWRLSVSGFEVRHVPSA